MYLKDLAIRSTFARTPTWQESSGIPFRPIPSSKSRKRKMDCFDALIESFHNQKKCRKCKKAIRAATKSYSLRYISKSDITRDYRAKLAEILYKNLGGNSKNSSQNDLKDCIDESNSGNCHIRDESDLAILLSAIEDNFIGFNKSIFSDSSSNPEQCHPFLEMSSSTKDLLSPNYITEVHRNDIMRRLNHIFIMSIKKPVPLSYMDALRESLNKLPDKSIKPEFMELYFDTIRNLNKMWEMIDLMDKTPDFSPSILIQFNSIKDLLQMKSPNFLKIDGHYIDKKTNWLNHLLKESKIKEDNKAKNEEDDKAEENEENKESKE